MRNYAENAIASGDLASLETAHGTMVGYAEKFAARGARDNQTAALVAAKAVDKAADGVATYDLLTRLASGDKLLVSDGRTPIFNANAADPSERRYAKLFPKVYESWGKKRETETPEEAETSRMMALKGMLEYTAEGNPLGFKTNIAESVMSGKMSPSLFVEMDKEFTKGWLKGNSRAERKLESIEKTAEGILNILNREIGKEDEATKTVSLPEREGKAGAIDEAMMAAIGEGYEPKELNAILAHALMLASNEGEEIFIDPLTGQETPPDKPHVVNAVQDFYGFIKNIKLAKERRDEMINSQLSLEIDENLRNLGATLPMVQEQQTASNPDDPNGGRQQMIIDPEDMVGAYGNGRDADDRKIPLKEYLDSKKRKIWAKYGRGENVVTAKANLDFKKRLAKIERFERLGLGEYKVPSGARHSRAWYEEQRKIAEEIRDMKTEKRLDYEAQYEDRKQATIRRNDDRSAKEEQQRREMEAERRGEEREKKRKAQATKVRRFREIEDEMDHLEEKYGDRDSGRIIKWTDDKQGRHDKARYKKMLRRRERLMQSIDWSLEEEEKK